ncbi:MAG: SusC/RagA family TonB-linked outer membrane protein, partial [Bacteroidota bacterium]
MMKKRLLFSLFCLFLSSAVVFAQQKVTGKVTDSDGEPLIGVNIIEVGTSKGTITDVDGLYAIEVSPSASLNFSYTGFADQTVLVGAQTTIDLVLKEGVDLGEVVVTALGISREKKALTYAAQNVDTEELSQARELNVVNSLSGKVAGLSIARSGGGVGADSRVILRGNRSLNNNNQPLYVVDGAPILGDITDINPDDIASISVLKGANAAALYGNRAQNGAIIITTKKGSEGFNVSLSTTLTADQPLFFRDYQQQFSQGNSGIYSPSSEQTWGAPLGGTQAHWSPDPNFGTSTYNIAANTPVEDFFQTGISSATNFSISGGTAQTQTYFSYTYTNASGVVPNNELARHNAHVRISNQVTDKFSIDAKLNYIREDIDNRLSQGENFDNPVRHAFRLPTNIRTEDIKIFEYTDDAGANRQHYWNPGSNGGANPYWTINRNQRTTATDRLLGLVSLKYEFTKELSVQVRSAIDRLNTDEDYRQWNDNYIIADDGRYTVSRRSAYEWNNDILVSYNKYLNKDFFLSVNAGANTRQERGNTLESNTGDALLVPNFFALQSQTIRSTLDVGTPRDVNSIYGFAQVGYKNAIYLDLTARNDWSSTLPSENWSFFYPSVGLSVVLSDLLELPEFFSYAKLRG